MSYKSSQNIAETVTYIQSRSENFLSLIQKHRTPFYVYDQESLDKNIYRFMSAFRSYRKDLIGYYAMKLNHHTYIIDRAVEKGMGIDVASRRELTLALKTKAKNIVYYSPGKNLSDLSFAIKHRSRVRIHVDSLAELERIGKLTKKLDSPLHISVRINFAFQGDWKKYGIPVEQLHDFWTIARSYKNLIVDGIHFHQSRNRDAKFYVYAFRKLAQILKRDFSQEELQRIKYVNFGGGFEPHQEEGVVVRKESSWPTCIITKNTHIEGYARTIHVAIQKYMDPLVSVVYCAEPGRYICNSAMHVAVSVTDVKDDVNIITDGGVNMVGWQRFEHEYFPVINLSRPSTKERAVNVWGNLCTTWDTWGYNLHGSDIVEKDTLVIPNQGALTYSLAQSFINKIPSVYKL